MAELSDPARSRVVLIGAATYEHLQLDNLPAVRNNVLSLLERLQDPAVWGVPARNCTALIDPASAMDVSRAVRAAATATGENGTLLVYYAGHGLIEPDTGDLILGLSGCDPAVPYEGGLHYEWIRKAVARSPARRRVVILDCCYAGRANPDMAADVNATMAVAVRAEAEGTCLLVSASANRRATAPEGATYTAFSGELVRIIDEGCPLEPPADPSPLITATMLWEEVKRAMHLRRLELPELRVRDSGGEIPLLSNAAARHRGPDDDAPFRSLTGEMLVSAPWIADDDLTRRAFLVLRHNKTGAMGICLTQPVSEIPTDFPETWRDLLAKPAALFEGGPLARDGYIVVAALRPGARPPAQFTPIAGRLGILTLTAAAEEVVDSVEAIRVFAGYLGWQPGQLEQYLSQGAMRVNHKIFTQRPDELWQYLQEHR